MRFAKRLLLVLMPLLVAPAVSGAAPDISVEAFKKLVAARSSDQAGDKPDPTISKALDILVKVGKLCVPSHTKAPTHALDSELEFLTATAPA